MRFDAISLARLMDIVNLITQWTLFEPQEETSLVCFPPEDMSFDDFINLRYVPVTRRDPWDKEVHRNAFKVANTYTEDQLLAHHIWILPR